MRDDASAIDPIAAPETTRRTAEALIAKYGWTVSSADELVTRVQGTIRQEGPTADLERLIIYHYTRALFEACRQADDLERRERGYTDLFRYLYRAAFNRWPAHAEDITQRALQLVYEQISSCAKPAAFLSFASFKLLQAHTELQRSTRDDQPLEFSDVPAILDDDASALSLLVQQEGLLLVMDALKRLPVAQQRAIFLKFFHGLSDEEIGSQLGVTAGYVRVQRFRGLKQLQNDQHLRDYFG